MEMPDMDFTQVLDRVKGILFDPETEWGPHVTDTEYAVPE